MRDAATLRPYATACVIAFNEERMLPGCLESLQGQVERVVVVDGAYALFPHVEPYSTDGTREIARCYGAEWIGCPVTEEGELRAWHTQMEKRSAYFVGEEGDWYFYIDADERLVGRLPEPEDGQHYAFRVRTRDGRLTWTPRLYQHVGWMRYEGAHNAMWSDERLVNIAGATKVDPEGCYILHLAQLRCEQRLRDKAAFLPGRYERERKYRRIHGI